MFLAVELFPVLISGGKSVTGVVCLFKIHLGVLRAKVKFSFFLNEFINQNK